jgi:type II secretory pathway component PulF
MPVPLWSRRLAKAADRIDAGERAESALRRARVLRRREASTLTLAGNQETLSWALREIADAATQRLFNRTSIIVQIALVVLVLVSAAIVCLMSVAVMSMLTQMVINLA